MEDYQEFLPKFLRTKGWEWEIFTKLHKTYSREEIALYLGLSSRTTVWKIHREILDPAILPDYDEYIKTNSKEVDMYCLTLFGSAWYLRKLTRSYPAAMAIMKENYLSFSRKSFNNYIQINVLDKLKGEFNVYTRNAA